MISIRISRRGGSALLATVLATSAALVGQAYGASLPSAPTAVSVTKAPSQLILHWSPPTSTGGSAITGYRVARDGTDADGYGAYSTVLASSARQVTFQSLRGGISYHLTVAAVSSAGTGPAAAIDAATTSVPGAPSVTVSLGIGTATVHWTTPSYDGGSAITGYVAKRDGTDTTGYGAWSTTVSATTTSWTFDKLKVGSRTPSPWSP